MSYKNNESNEKETKERMDMFMVEIVGKEIKKSGLELKLKRK